METKENIKFEIQKLLQDDIIQFTLKGTGAVNNAYYIETQNGGKYIVKQERKDKEFQPQNDLVVEANVIKQLHALNISYPVPRVVFVSETPKMYGYEYIEGEMMKEIWASLTEEEKINICKELGYFHAEIGKKFTKDMAEAIGIKIDPSADVHPEITIEYNSILADASVPEEFKSLAREARAVFDATADTVVFQFLHNDAHHENVLIKDKKISGIIDFGNAEYGEIAKEFSRYIRDFPDHFQHIVSAYEEGSGNKLSYKHLVSNSLLSGAMEIVEEYKKGGDKKIKAENSIAIYRKLLNSL